jgi:membrane protein YdbS with pleckstrin-like domain
MLSVLRAHGASLWPGHDVTATLDDDEEIKDVVRQHRVVLVVPVLVGFLGLAIALVPGWPRVADAVGLVMVAWAGWHAVLHSVDRFVITNHRVFRVRGVLRRSRASMPIRRVLDITVHKPLMGLLFGYGHFVFESAAQEQGLREIRFVGDPDGRERTIQRLITRARACRPRRRTAPGAAAPTVTPTPVWCGSRTSATTPRSPGAPSNCTDPAVVPQTGRSVRQVVGFASGPGNGAGSAVEETSWRRRRANPATRLTAGPGGRPATTPPGFATPTSRRCPG